MRRWWCFLQQVIQSLKGHDDKVRVVLNKADQVDMQQLMRVYGALMWSLGKVFRSPEVGALPKGCKRIIQGVPVMSDGKETWNSFDLGSPWQHQHYCCPSACMHPECNAALRAWPCCIRCCFKSADLKQLICCKAANLLTV